MEKNLDQKIHNDSMKEIEKKLEEEITQIRQDYNRKRDHRQSGSANGSGQYCRGRGRNAPGRNGRKQESRGRGRHGRGLGIAIPVSIPVSIPKTSNTEYRF